MNKNLETLWRAVLAGVMIGIGGTLFLSVDNKVVGAFLFGIGLFGIFTGGLNLFTGKVGFAVVRPASFLFDLLIIWCGNLIGTFLTAFVQRFTRVYPALSEKAAGICAAKFSDSLLSLFCLAMFCGMLMFFAADRYGRVQDSAGKNLAVFLPVMVFILCGFEHCVANMYYFSIAGVWSADGLVRMVVMSLGNSAGALVLSFSEKMLGVLKG